MANKDEVFQGGATTSQHVDAEDDSHFENTTFKLKRTRSLGLLDEFIDSEQQEKQIERKIEQKQQAKELAAAASLDSDSASAPSPATPTSSAFPHGQSSVDSPAAQPPTSSSSDASTNLPVVNNSAYLSPDILPHDDSDLAPEPSRHVDYLSHQWDVFDISKSWRYVILRKKNVANAARLENASWRTWAQRRSNLKTISPEEVNWSKESDVTWLYGPIVDDDDHDHDMTAAHDDSRSLNTASSVVAGDILIPRKAHRPKPILKKRTVEDMMISHLNLLKLQIATARADQEQTRREDAAAQARKDAAAKSASSEKPPEYFDYDAISAKLNSQYKNYSQSNSENNSSVDLVAKASQVSSAKLSSELEKVASNSQNRQPSILSQKQPAAEKSEPEERHIHFNDEVQQCIAIDDFYSDDDYDDYEGDDYDYSGEDSFLYESYSSDSLDQNDRFADEDDEDDDDEDEGGFFLNVKSPSSANMAGALPGLSSNSASKLLSKSIDLEAVDSPLSKSDFSSFKTIHPLPPTTLNYESYDEESDEENPYTSSISHNVDSNCSRGYDYYYDYNSVYQVDPNHAIYGDHNKLKAPDVVDVPENITVGSNFDYEIIENEDMMGSAQGDPRVYSYQSGEPSTFDSSLEGDQYSVSHMEYSGSTPTKPLTFSFEASDSDSGSDSDSDGNTGLSISARNSSQSLAQLVFGQPMSALSAEDDHFPANPAEEPEPEAKHISTINPRYSSTSLSKQPHSSNSLSGQFFGEGFTKADKSSELSRLFFDLKAEDLPDAVASPEPEAKPELITHGSFSGSQTPVQRKATPVPPQTTSENAFLGSLVHAKKSFIFDSGSESEDDLDREATPPVPTGERNPTSYLSLYEVAGRNGIAVPEQESLKNKRSLSRLSFLGWKGS